MAAAAFFAARRGEFVGDGGNYLVLYLAGFREHPLHFLTFDFLGAGERLARLAGLTYYDGVHALNALAMGTALGLAHAGFRRLLDGRGVALRATLLAATAPAVVLYGTAYELHALLMVFAGAVVLAAGRYAARPSFARAVAIGGLAGLSHLAHASGPLLATVGATLALGGAALHRGGGVRWLVRLAPHALAIAGAAVLVALLETALLRALGWSVGFLRGGSYVVDSASGAMDDVKGSPGTLAATFVREWLVAFLPLSLLWPLAGRVPRGRALLAAFAPCWVLWLILTHLVLGDLEENGSYMLPLALPAACLTALALPGRLVPAAAALGVVTFATCLGEVRREDVRAFADEVRAAGDSACFLIADHVDAEPFLVECPHVEWFALDLLLRQDEARVRSWVPGIVLGLETRLAEGRRVFVTRRARRRLDATGDAGAARALADAILGTFTLRELPDNRFCRFEIAR